MTKINLEIPNCPICGGKTFETVLSKTADHIWRKPGQFTVQRCTTCQLVMTRPRPADDSLGFYYENTYSGEGRDDMKRFQSENFVMRWISLYRIRVMEKAKPILAEDTCLDVGCSYGGFLDTLATERGCRGYGIDLDEGAIQQAVQNEKLRFETNAIDTLKMPTEQFDWVTFWESLEHHAQPIEALARAYELLKPGGFCCVEVPNFDGFWRIVFGRYWLPLLMPQHLFHFTKDSITNAGLKAGFRTRTHHQSMFYPLEGVASLGIALSKWLKSPPPGSPPSWRTPFDLTILFCLIVLYVIVEIPSQWLLTYWGRSGHQLVIFQKPTQVKVDLPDSDLSQEEAI